jgi:hypothetical protein
MKIESRAVIINTFSVSSSLNPSESALAAILAEVLVGVSTVLVSFTYTKYILYFILTPHWGKIIGWYGILESIIPSFGQLGLAK